MWSGAKALSGTANAHGLLTGLVLGNEIGSERREPYRGGMAPNKRTFDMRSGNFWCWYNVTPSFRLVCAYRIGKLDTGHNVVLLTKPVSLSPQHYLCCRMPSITNHHPWLIPKLSISNHFWRQEICRIQMSTTRTKNWCYTIEDRQLPGQART